VTPTGPCRSGPIKHMSLFGMVESSGWTMKWEEWDASRPMRPILIAQEESVAIRARNAFLGGVCRLGGWTIILPAARASSATRSLQSALCWLRSCRLFCPATNWHSPTPDDAATE